MKKNILISVVLFSICSVVAIMMVLINAVTDPKIKENEEETTNEMLTILFKDMDRASDMENVNDNKYVVGYYIIYKEEVEIGRVYKGKGANGYGNITMLVGIDNNSKITGVQYLENTQTKNGSTIELVGYDYVTNPELSDITSTNSADIKSGVTYGSNLVNDIMSSIKAYASKEV